MVRYDIGLLNWKSTVSGIGKYRKSSTTVTVHKPSRLCCLQSACIYVVIGYKVLVYVVIFRSEITSK
jgi:hypothetical protein